MREDDEAPRTIRDCENPRQTARSASAAPILFALIGAGGLVALRTGRMTLAVGAPGVGVGSVGTRCWVVLLSGRDENDPLLLQVKEAQPSVLARYVGDCGPGLLLVLHGATRRSGGRA